MASQPIIKPDHPPIELGDHTHCGKSKPQLKHVTRSFGKGADLLVNLAHDENLIKPNSDPMT